MTARIAVGQAPFSADVERNVATARGLRAAANAEGADLLLLSELFLSGYRVEGLDGGRAVTLDDPRLAPLAEDDSPTELLVGAAVEGPGGLRNAVLRFRAGHAPEIAYTKLHLWESERGPFVAGESLSVIEAGGLRIGLGICYDAGFPEFSRAYAHAGVDLIAFASAFLVGEEAHRYDVYHPARALESGCYVVVSDAAGIDDGDRFYGHSRIFDPRGRVLADLGSSGELALVDVSPSEVAATRAALPYLDHLQTAYRAHP